MPLVYRFTCDHGHYRPRGGKRKAGVRRGSLERPAAALQLTGFLGPVVAFVIWLKYRDDSPRVASHALRSVFYQTAWLVAIVVGWTVAGLLLMVVLVGFLLVPVMLLVTVALFVQATYEAYRAYRGEDRL
jgi:uncharacterized Tic20 family protein